MAKIPTYTLAWSSVRETYWSEPEEPDRTLSQKCGLLDKEYPEGENTRAEGFTAEN